MPQTAEYKVIHGTNSEQLHIALSGAAMQGFQPILMASAGTAGGVVTTVILEHKIGS